MEVIQDFSDFLPASKLSTLSTANGVAIGVFFNSLFSHLSQDFNVVGKSAILQTFNEIVLFC